MRPALIAEAEFPAETRDPKSRVRIRTQKAAPRSDAANILYFLRIYFIACMYWLHLHYPFKLLSG